jgi:hypothetical protein
MSLVTGKNCLIKIGDGASAKSYEKVTNKYDLNFDSNAVEYATLAGPLAGPGSESGTLDLTWAYDSGETPDSLFDDLWAAADAGTPVKYEATVGKSVFKGECVASRPNIPADASNPSECSVSMKLNGIPVKSAIPVVTPPAPPAK